MFNKDRYISRGIDEEIPVEIQMLLWSMINEINVEKDYLQVFELEPLSEYLLKVTHKQQSPSYHKFELLMNVGITSKKKIFVIDDGECSTMILSSEY